MSLSIAHINKEHKEDAVGALSRILVAKWNKKNKEKAEKKNNKQIKQRS